MSTTAIPHNELLGQVREAWADVLGTDTAQDVPLDVNFLEAGGNSLLLVMLWEQLQPLAGRPVKLSELFQHGTVAAQAELLARPVEAVTVIAPGEMTVPAGRSLLAQRRAASAGGAG